MVLASATGARAEERDFCPDRPGLGTPACTIKRGRVAVELGLGDWSHDGTDESESDAFTAGALLLRAGLTDSLEAQVGWEPFGQVRTRDRASATIDKASGSGDLLVALRQNLRSPDGSGFAIALMPYATLPVGGRTLGAGDWGAGLIVPMSRELPGGFALGLTLQADAAVDADRDGRHLGFGAILGLDVPLAETLGATFEIAGSRDEDPAGHASEWLAGVSAGWTPSADFQVDAGANIGLNPGAADVQLYVGVARRF